MTTRLLIATHSGIFYIELDDKFEICSSKRVSSGYHYGITNIRKTGNKTAECYFYNGGEDVLKQTTPTIKKALITESDIQIDEEFSLSVEEFGQIHQIEYMSNDTNNDSIYVVNTEFNSIVSWEKTKGILSTYHVNNVSYDLNHVNSVHVDRNHIAIMLHNKRKMESQIEVLIREGATLKKEAIYSLFDVQCHNIELDEENLFYNASADRSFVSIDRNSGKVRKRIKFAQHTKGLACEQEYILVGLSDYTKRDQRSTSSSWIAILRKDSLEKVKILPLNIEGIGDRIGNVNEIRVLNNTNYFDTPSSLSSDLISNNLNGFPLFMLRRKIQIEDVLKTKLKKILTSNR